MAHNTLLFLETVPRHAALAVKKILGAEDFEPVATAKEALGLLKEDPAANRLFVISRENQWVAVGLHGEHMDHALASALAGESGNNGWIVDKGNRGKLEVWQIKHGQRDEEPQQMSQRKLEDMLAGQGITKRLLDFKVSDHLLHEDTKLGKHEDVVLGFTSIAKDETEVDRALAEEETPPKDSEPYSLEEFLDQAVGNEKVRAIAMAQINEQLKKDGFGKTLQIMNPEPQGHYCEAFDAESYSFTSNGSYVWFEWSCEEACEPRLDEELAFPSCDLKFRIEKAIEV